MSLWPRTAFFDGAQEELTLGSNWKTDDNGTTLDFEYQGTKKAWLDSSGKFVLQEAGGDTISAWHDGSNAQLLSSVGSVVLNSRVSVPLSGSNYLTTGTLSLRSSDVLFNHATAAGLQNVNSTGYIFYNNWANSAADLEHHATIAQNALTHDGQMLHVWGHNGATDKRAGITIHGAFAVWMTNRSGGNLVTGDVVVYEGTDVLSVTQSPATANLANVRGVWWSSTTADDASGWCVTFGPTKCKLEASTTTDTLISTSGSTAGTGDDAGVTVPFARTLEVESGGFGMVNVLLGLLS